MINICIFKSFIVMLEMVKLGVIKNYNHVRASPRVCNVPISCKANGVEKKKTSFGVAWQSYHLCGNKIGVRINYLKKHNNMAIPFFT